MKLKQQIVPIIQFTETAWDKMWALVDNCPQEIGWHGLVTRDENKYLIYDILVYPQTVTAASITCDDKEFGKWMADFMTNPEFPYNDLRMHGHSHVNMQCFPSNVDTNLQETLTAHLNEEDFYIFFIINKKRDMWINIHDNANGIIFETGDILINPNKQLDWAAEEMKKNLKEKKYTVSNYKSYTQGTSSKNNKDKEVAFEQLIIDQYLEEKENESK